MCVHSTPPLRPREATLPYTDIAFPAGVLHVRYTFPSVFGIKKSNLSIWQQCSFIFVSIFSPPFYQFRTQSVSSARSKSEHYYKFVIYNSWILVLFWIPAYSGRSTNEVTFPEIEGLCTRDGSVNLRASSVLRSRRWWVKSWLPGSLGKRPALRILVFVGAKSYSVCPKTSIRHEMKEGCGSVSNVWPLGVDSKAKRPLLAQRGQCGDVVGGGFIGGVFVRFVLASGTLNVSLSIVDRTGRPGILLYTILSRPR